MTITRVQGNARGTAYGADCTVTMGATPTQGNVLIATIVSNGGAYTKSIIQTNVAWFRQVQKRTSSVASEIWLGFIGASASTSVVISSGSAMNRVIADICEYSGVNCLDLTAGSSGQSTNPDSGTTGTTNIAEELWIGALAVYNTYNGTTPVTHSAPTNGFTLLDGADYSTGGTNSSIAFLEKIVSSVGAANVGTTITNYNQAYTYWAGCVATFYNNTNVSLVQAMKSTKISSGSEIAVTLDTAPTDGNMLIATIGTLNLASTVRTVSSITQTGVTWTKQINKTTAWHTGAEIWAGVVGSGASASITITLSGTVTEAVSNICEYSGIVASGFLDKTASASGNATSGYTGVTDTTTQNEELWIGVIASEINMTPQSNITDMFSPFMVDYASSWLTVSYAQRITKAVGTAGFYATCGTSAAQYSGCVAAFKISTGPAEIDRSAASAISITATAGKFGIKTRSGSGVLSSIGAVSRSILTVRWTYEGYDTGDNDSSVCYGDEWRAQTFTTGVLGHTVALVKLKLLRYGNPGVMTVSIRATSGNHPTGSDLTVGTIDASGFTENSSGEWYQIPVTEYALAAGTKYAIVVRAVDGDPSNYVLWRADITAPTYDDGNDEDSSDAGVNWTTLVDYDFMFRLCGNAIPVAYTRSGSASLIAIAGADYFNNLEELPVDNYDITSMNDWVKIGVDPYLDLIDDPVGYIYDRNDNEDIGDFQFKRSAQTGIPGSVKLQVYCKRGSLGGTIDVYLDPGDGYVYAGTVTPDETYSWKELNVKAILDTNLKVANAKMYLKHQAV